MFSSAFLHKINSTELAEEEGYNEWQRGRRHALRDSLPVSLHSSRITTFYLTVMTAVGAKGLIRHRQRVLPEDLPFRVKRDNQLEWPAIEF